MVKRVFLTVTILILLFVGIAFAADGADKGNIFQVISGLLALVIGGGGAAVYKKIKVIGDLKEAIGSSVQAFAAVQLFAKRVPDTVKMSREYNGMMTKLDMCSEEYADVLSAFKVTEKYAPMLRNLIRESMYVSSKNETVDMIREQYIENTPMMDSFNDALEELKK